MRILSLEEGTAVSNTTAHVTRSPGREPVSGSPLVSKYSWEQDDIQQNQHLCCNDKDHKSAEGIQTVHGQGLRLDTS
jgi:hypothetical protein